MRKLLAEIRTARSPASGSRDETGEHKLEELRAAAREQQIEQVGSSSGR
jgi:hypothetical protein